MDGFSLAIRTIKVLCVALSTYVYALGLMLLLYLIPTDVLIGCLLLDFTPFGRFLSFLWLQPHFALLANLLHFIWTVVTFLEQPANLRHSSFRFRLFLVEVAIVESPKYFLKLSFVVGVVPCWRNMRLQFVSLDDVFYRFAPFNSAEGCICPFRRFSVWNNLLLNQFLA